MWLFTSFSFFNIVRKTDGPHLTIPSLSRVNLLRLRQHYLPHAGTAYPWRMLWLTPTWSRPCSVSRRIAAKSTSRWLSLTATPA